MPGGLSVHPRPSPPQISGPTLWNRLTFPLRLPVGTTVIHSWFQVPVVAPIYWTSLALCCMALPFNVLFLRCSVHLTAVICWCSIRCPGVLLRQAGYNFRFLMYKTGTARMARQGLEGKICRALKARGD